MIEAIIFDLDGTVLDSMPMWQNFGRNYLKSLGIEAKAGMERDLFVMTPQQSAQYFIDEYAVNKTVDEMVSDMQKMAYQFYREKVVAKAGIKALLNELHKQNILLGIATVSHRDFTRAGLARNGLLDYFSAIVSVSDVGIGKESPAVFLEAAKLLHAEPARSIVVEDALHALETAKRADFMTVGVYDSGNYYFQDKLKQTCDLYLENYQNPKKILELLRQLQSA